MVYDNIAVELNQVKWMDMFGNKIIHNILWQDISMKKM